MTTYAFPSIIPNRSVFELRSNSKTFASPLSGAIQTAFRGGTRWAMQLFFDNLTGDNRSEMQAFLVKLNGQVHYFTVHDHSYTIRGTGGGTPVVNGASQTGTSLVTNGWTASATVLKAGDYFSFTNGTFDELKMVTGDVTSDGSGNATLNFLPEIHVSPANGATIDVTDPLGTFLLVNPNVSWTNVPKPFSNFEIQAMEVIVP